MFEVEIMLFIRQVSDKQNRKIELLAVRVGYFHQFFFTSNHIQINPMSVFGFIFAGFLALIYIVYKWATRDHEYFVRRGVPALKPALFFGNSADFFTKKVDLIDFVIKLYNDFPEKK